MAGYKRIVSYIYYYEDHQRKERAGFVKAQKKTNEWRMEVCIQGKHAQGVNGACVYLYVTENGICRKLRVGEITSANQIYTWEGSTREEGILTAIRSEDAEGVWIEKTSGQIYVAQWDDLPMDPEVFQAYAEDITPEKAAEVPPEIVVSAESLVKAQTIAADGRKQKWEYLMEHFPVQKVQNQEGLDMECVRIGPKDLQRLPRKDWVLGNNSFLLHGYYLYRHLLLCRREGENSAEYFLGVPGVYDEKERMMAELFGFNDFCKSGNPKDRDGRFGYWFRKIEEA